MRRPEFIFLLILLPLDYLAVFFSFLLGYYLKDYLDSAYLQPFPLFIKLAAILSFFWVLGFIISGLYRMDLKRLSLDEFFAIILGTGLGATLSSATIFISKEFDFSRLILLVTTLIVILMVFIGRGLVKILQDLFYGKEIGVKRVLVVGMGKEADLVIKAFQENGDSSYKVLGKVDFEKFAKTLVKLSVDEVVAADPSLDRSMMNHIFDLCEEAGVNFKFVPDVFHGSPATVTSEMVDGLPLIELKATTLDGWTVIFKRLLDVSVAGFGLLATLPLLLIIALLIKLDSPGPAFFPHLRVGRNGKEFYLFKFRSMHMFRVDGQLVHASEDREVEKLKEAQPNYKLPEDPRVTRVGKIIRRTSIDELPQLWNVLKGEMSVIGPRAYIKKELEVQRQRFPETTELIRRLLTVKPGITGLWQVSGRSRIDFSGRVAMDAYYASHVNLLMDLRIMLKTIPVVLRGSGAM